MLKPRGNNQQRILDYIKGEILRKGYPPSVREIGNAVGLKSTSTVHGHLIRLEKKGLLHRDSMKPRAMEIINDPLFTHQANTMVPIIGHVAAGIPILAEENIEEYFPIAENILGTGEHFILHVRGDSMIQAGILDKDYVVVLKQSYAYNGEIIVALIDDDATVKRYYKENDVIRLQPENPAMLPIYVKNITILGKVIMLYRRINS